MNIKDLVKKYHSNREAYLKPEYNETQLRIDFLDPFFELLGWDIKNLSGKPTNEREVLVEEGLRADITSNTKKPDYTFRLFAERKFFLEAKKPNVKIDIDNEPAKQIRRYGFTAKLKISVLSNFEYLAIYDCSQKVEVYDSVAKSRIRLYHYTEYEAAFDDILEQLGHQSVYTGQFDDTWQEIEQQLRLSSVDDLFLKQINEWRIILGKEIYFLKPELSVSELNDIVQSYINSTIFLRVCEDRNLEVYKTLLNFADNQDFKALIKKFKEADKKYNAGLFNLPFQDEIISNNHSAFWEIIKQLYFPESSYSFSVFASDILGNIYEIFLGQQLDIDNDQVRLKRKPENIDRDIVTTPTYIIQDILRQTVVEHCKNKTDVEILGSSFADIACGSGAFLLETYQLLQDTLVDYYLATDQTKLIQISINTFKLPFTLKKEILENCIFGVDKDYNAVQACKFGLLLKLLENEDNATITLPALPSLEENIQFGNSLIAPSETDRNNRDAINPFDFGETQYDVIVGNPPYMATEHIKEFTPLELPIYKTKYNSSYKQFDKYFLFIERGFELLKKGGYFGYIVPSKFAKVGAGKKLRNLLVSDKAVQQIISFGAHQVFHNKTTYTCILILKKQRLNQVKYLEVNSLKNWRTRNIGAENFDEFTTDSLKEDGWILYPSALKPAYASIVSQSKPLEDLIGSDNIYNGIQTSANNIYIHSIKKDDDNFIYFNKNGKDWKIEKILTRPYFKTSNGDDNLNTYRPFSPNAFVIYPYIKTDDGLEFVNIQDLKANYPNAYKYLIHYKDKLDNERRDIKPKPETENEWYRYGRHQSLEKCDVPAKIIVGVLAQGNKYAIDYYGTLISSGGTAGYCMITLPKDFTYSIYYIQALLNSKYLEWFSALIGEVFRGGYIARGTKVLKKLPIRIIDFDDKSEKEIHDKIAGIQKELIELQGKIDKHRDSQRKVIPFKREFDALKIELDETLKTLYNLGEVDSLIPLISELYATT
ncbi:Eco57I restriction-modification methylase domain-containing protein [Zunongwangia profunda]|uniref:Eco57I restriction-modification methylase domain-containing protein n=1 Tax=Zunongwangia profunda TaxID=398743 RepID=UPI001D18DB46|nr:N-6 DNA methylase [Zunongwangia profunda]MCC4227114.1 N-6 DNA methylase [Zunongwangia profunda]